MGDPTHLPSARCFTDKNGTAKKFADDRRVPLTADQRAVLRDRLLRGQTPQAAAAEAEVTDDALAAALSAAAVRDDLDAVDRLRSENLLALAYQRALKGSDRMLDLFLKYRPPTRGGDRDDDFPDLPELMGLSDAEFDARYPPAGRSPERAAERAAGPTAGETAVRPRRADGPHPAGLPDQPRGAAGPARADGRRAAAG